MSLINYVYVSNNNFSSMCIQECWTYPRDGLNRLRGSRRVCVGPPKQATGGVRRALGFQEAAAGPLPQA